MQRRTGTTFSPVSLKERNKPGQNISKSELQIYRPRVKKNSAAERKVAPSKVMKWKDTKPEAQRNTKTQPQKANQPTRQKQEQQGNNQQAKQQQAKQQRNDQQAKQQQAQQQRNDQQAKQQQAQQQRNDQQANSSKRSNSTMANRLNNRIRRNQQNKILKTNPLIDVSRD